MYHFPEGETYGELTNYTLILLKPFNLWLQYRTHFYSRKSYESEAIDAK